MTHPAVHQMRKRPPTISPRTDVGANSAACGGRPGISSALNHRGSLITSGVQTGRRVCQASRSAAYPAIGKGVSRKSVTSSSGTWYPASGRSTAFRESTK